MTDIEDPRVNFEKRFANYEIYTWTLCHSYLYEKQTDRIQSLNKTELAFLGEKNLNDVNIQY